MTLPELSAPAECYYDKTRSVEYNRNSRIGKIQADITTKAIELLDLNECSTILDLGCGSGLSGQTIALHGHYWVGTDISPDMLSIAKEVPGCNGLIASDFGSKWPFADDAFDYAISVSAVQWLLHSYKKEHIPIQRTKCFFRNLYRVVSKKAVIQFYCDKKGTAILTQAATAAGFHGGIVIVAENTKNEKRFLVLHKERSNKKIEKIPLKKKHGKVLKK